MKSTFLLTMIICFGWHVAQAFVVPKKSTVLPGYYEEAKRDSILQNATDRLEGLWYYPDEHLTLAIEKLRQGVNHREEAYRIVVVETDDCSTDYGSIIGYMEKTAERNKLRIWLYSGMEANLPINPVESVATVDSDYATILIDRPKVKIRISANIMQLLPTIFNGIRIYPRYEKADVKPGFKRIHPNAPTSELQYF